MKLSKLNKTGATMDDLWKYGFDGETAYDEEEGELYFDLLLGGQVVGFTQINEENGDVEIICENRINYKKVIELVGDKVTVWAWYCSKEDRLFNKN